MPVIGCGDSDRIYLFERQDLPEVLFSGGRFAHLLLRGVGELLENIAVYVADIRDPRRGLVRLKRRKMRIGPAIQADDRKVEAVVGSHDLGIALGGRADGQTRRSHRQCVEKLPPSNHISPLKGPPTAILPGFVYSTNEIALKLRRKHIIVQRALQDEVL